MHDPKTAMIPRSAACVQSGVTTTWQSQLRNAGISVGRLLDELGLDEHDVALAESGLRQFPLRVPPVYRAQIRYGDPGDPLLRQILPAAAEDTAVTGFDRDPVGDQAAEKRPGLLHKYHGRVLLTLTGACAIHCRYCFRRHFPYSESNPVRGAWQSVLDYIRHDTSIREVIFSGGDPLSLPDRRLNELSADLAAIPHLARLRIHSRMPVVVPERITDSFIDWLAGLPLRPVLVIHVNHGREIGPAAAAALGKLHQAGIHLLNQAVLLRGVNDSVTTQGELSEQLFAHHVLPYYLHTLDAVDGAAHFDVPLEQARALMTELRTQLPGYLVPRLVREQAGTPYKTPLL